MLCQMGGNLKRDVFLPCMNLPDNLYKLLRRHGLEHITLSPCLQCSLDFDVSFKGSQHDDAGIRKLSANCYHSVNAADIGQSQIHERNVGQMLTVSLHGFVP